MPTAALKRWASRATRNVLNWSQSAFGPGWNLTGLDALAPATAGGPAGVSLVESNGTMTFFWSNGSGGYNAEPGPFAFDTLTFNSSTSLYTLQGANGTEEIFNATGQLTTVVDSDGNQTSYNYTSGLLTSIDARATRRPASAIRAAWSPWSPPRNRAPTRAAPRPWPTAAAS